MKYSKLPAERYGKWIFGNRYNRALWCPPIISKMVTNNAFYRISVLVSSLFIADVSPAHISAQHQSGQIKSKHIHILIWFPKFVFKLQIPGWRHLTATVREPGTAANDAWKVPAEAVIGSLTISSAFWVSVHLSARIFALVFLRHYSGSSQCPGAGCLFRLRLDISRQCVLHVPDVTADN